MQRLIAVWMRRNSNPGIGRKNEKAGEKYINKTPIRLAPEEDMF